MHSCRSVDTSKRTLSQGTRSGEKTKRTVLSFNTSTIVHDIQVPSSLSFLFLDISWYSLSLGENIMADFP